MDGSGIDSQGGHGRATPRPRRKIVPLSIIAVEEETARAGYRLKGGDLRPIYEALAKRDGTVECLTWILGKMREKGDAVRTPATYLLKLVESYDYVAKWWGIHGDSTSQAAASQPAPLRSVTAEADLKQRKPECLADEHSEGSARSQKAVDWLLMALATGPILASELERQALANGISKKTLWTASKKVEVKKTQAGFHGGWHWTLPTCTGSAGESTTCPQRSQFPQRRAVIRARMD